MKKNLSLVLLRTVALIVLLMGAGASLVLTLHAGRNNHSVFLRVLFVFWVLSPFLALLVANTVSKRWPILARRTLYFLMLALTLGSLVIYSGALSPRGTKPAFVFLLVPLISWLIIIIVIPIAVWRSRKLPTRSRTD